MRNPPSTLCRAAAGRLSLVTLAALLATAIGAAFPARAEDPGAPEVPATLSLILDAIPYEDAATSAKMMQQLAGLGPSGIEDLAGLIVAPSKIDDSRARFAMHALALYVARPGADPQRLAFCRTLRKLLTSDRPDVVKAFFVQQLRFVACPEAVAALAPLLLNERLCEDASQVLVSIGGEEARAALRDALPDAKGACRLTLIQNLGVLRDAASAASLKKAARDADRNVRLAALFALGNIGEASATGVLLQATQVEAPYERAAATDAALLLARRLGEAEHKKEAETVYRTLWKTRPDPREGHVRCAAIQGLAAVLGVGAMDDLVAALGSDDAQIRGAAIEAAVAMPGDDVTKRWVSHMESLPADGKVAILSLLARRGGDEAQRAVFDAMRQKDEAVRLAAIEATQAFPGTQTVVPLIAFLASENGNERDAARKSLERIGSDEASAAIASALPAAAPGVRRELLGVLTGRGARAQVDAILAATTDPDKGVREAALRSLEVLGEEKHVPALVTLVVQVEDGGERGRAEKALGAVCARSNRDRCAETVIGAMDGASVDARAALIRVLGKTPSDKALEAVRAALKDAGEAIQDAAVRVLAEWPDPKVAGDLMALAEKAEKTTHRVLALRGYVRLASETKASSDAVLAMYKKAFEAAQRTEEKRLALAGLADVRSLGAMNLALAHMVEGALCEEAAAAVLKIAGGISSTHPAEAEAALGKAIGATKSNRLRKDAGRLLDQLRRDREYVKAWVASGPYRQAGRSSDALFDMPFAPENDPKQAKWKAIGGADSKIDLGRELGGSDAVAYLRTRIWSPEDQDARLELGSDDGLKVWFNGKVVSAKNVPRSLTPGEDKVDVRLKKGWNVLMLKVTQGNGDWLACAKLVARETGKALKGIRVDPLE